jgi:hypothetical protein
VVELESGLRMCIAYQCGEIMSERKAEEGSIGDNEMWAALTHLRKLESLVKQLKAAAQGACDGSKGTAGKTVGRTTEMGGDTRREAVRNDPDLERDDLATDEGGGRG